MYTICDNITPSKGRNETPFRSPDREVVRNRMKMLIADARARGWLLHTDGNSDKFIGRRDGQEGAISIMQMDH